MTYKPYRRKTDEEKKTEIDGLFEKLEEGVNRCGNSEEYKKILMNVSKYHNYSLNNLLLIYMQNPNSTYVASYTDWKQKFNRQVQYGEHGIKILCPIIQKRKVVNYEKDENGNQVMDENGNPKILNSKDKQYVATYKIGYVYDYAQVEQIEGKEVVELDICKNLTGKINGYELLKESIIETSDADISFDEIPGGAHGYYKRNTHNIVIQDDMPEAQTIKTMIHEVAHSILHADESASEMDREDKEVQAESTAYVVCTHFGLNTEDYSFPYVYTWQGNEDRLRNNLDAIRKASDQIINRMEEYIEDHLGENQEVMLEQSVEMSQVNDTNEIGF